jgi:hypothetical protein
MSSPGLPVMGPGAYVSGAHPRSGSYAAMPAPGGRRGTGPRTSTIVVVVLLLLVWFVWIAWWVGHDDEQPGPSSPSPAPAGAPATAPGAGAGGLYRFADQPSPPPGDAKKAKPIKKPKRDDDD